MYISKTRHLFLNELYFGFFQIFEDSMLMTQHFCRRHKSLYKCMYIYIYILKEWLGPQAL